MDSLHNQIDIQLKRVSDFLKNSDSSSEIRTAYTKLYTQYYAIVSRHVVQWATYGSLSDNFYYQEISKGRIIARLNSLIYRIYPHRLISMVKSQKTQLNVCPECFGEMTGSVSTCLECGFIGPPFTDFASPTFRKPSMRREDPYITRLLKREKISTSRPLVFDYFHRLVDYIFLNTNLQRISGYGYYINKILELNDLPKAFKDPKNQTKYEKLWQDFLTTL